MVTDGNRETNLVAMVAVKANSVELLFDRHTHEKLKMLISPISETHMILHIYCRHLYSLDIFDSEAFVE